MSTTIDHFRHPERPEAALFATDFDALRRGQSYESQPSPIGARDVAVFAGLTGDTHPVHVDPEWAASGPFGRRIAHGLLVLSCAAGSLPLDPDRVLALRRLREVVFKRPVSVGESIVVRCEVRELRAIDAGTGLVECEWRITGTDGRLRVRAVVEILWRRAATGDVDPATAGIRFEAPVPGPDHGDELAPVEVTEDGLRVLI